MKPIMPELVFSECIGPACLYVALDSRGALIVNGYFDSRIARNINCHSLAATDNHFTNMIFIRQRSMIASCILLVM